MAIQCVSFTIFWMMRLEIIPAYPIQLDTLLVGGVIVWGGIVTIMGIFKLMPLD